MPTMTAACRLYGCDLVSDLTLPGYEPHGDPLAEIALWSATGKELAARGAPVTVPVDDWFIARPLPDGSIYLRWTDLFEFVVDPGGREVLAHPLAGATRESLQTYLLGQVLSFALLRQGIEPLHATAVTVEGRAVAFIGETGGGKSTLGAAFLAAGHRLLTDDLLVTSTEEAGPFTFPGPPRLKLFPEVAALFPSVAGGPGEGRPGTPMNPDVAKRVIPMPPELAPLDGRGVPLAACYVLEPDEQADRPIRIDPLRPTASFLELTRYTFNTMVEERDRLERQFHTATDLAARLPVRRLWYPRDLDRLEEVRDAVLDNLRTCI